MWITERPADFRPREQFSIYSETGRRARRHHQKSRNGCTHCRRRRIKCDEGRPSCSPCVLKQVFCQYPSGATIIQPDGPTTVISDISLASEINLACLEKLLASTENADHELDDFLPVARLHARESLAHFAQCDRSWLKSPKVQQVLQGDAIARVINRPYVLHSVLALSAAHLAYLKPGQRTYRLASLVHWQHSLRSYSHHFAADIQSENAAEVYFANMLQAMLAFMYARLPLPNEDIARPNWVVTMQGKKMILDSPHVADQLGHTIWEPLVRAHGNWQQRSSTLLALVRSEMPDPTIQALLNYSKTQSPEKITTYEERIYFLAMLRHIPRVSEAIGAFVSFVSEAPASFVKMVKSGESFALLLLYCWSQIFASLDQWWITGPAAIERDRLYAYLSRDGDDDIQALLDNVTQSWISPTRSMKDCGS